MSNNSTFLWWAALCAVSAINILAWSAAAARAHQQAKTLPADARLALRLQVLLSAGYVLGCAYRSAFPVYDVGRMVIVDSFWSSVAVGRSVATVAELCFAAQWALLMHAVARAGGVRWGLRVAQAVLPMIVLAEICSWHSVLTTSNLGHVLEETLWGLCAASLVVSLALMWPRVDRALRPVVALAVVMGVAYVGYMFNVDVPMYWTRWLAEAQHQHLPLSLSDGFADAASRWVVSHRWADWQSEVVWMSLYFSVAVWMSIGFIHLPARMLAPRPVTPR